MILAICNCVVHTAWFDSAIIFYKLDTYNNLSYGIVLVQNVILMNGKLKDPIRAKIIFFIYLNEIVTHDSK